MRDLGNARLLTMRGDGHTAYTGSPQDQNSACVDAAVDAYLAVGTLPPPGTQCKQDTPFAAPTAAAQGASRGLRLRPLTRGPLAIELQPLR